MYDIVSSNNYNKNFVVRKNNKKGRSNNSYKNPGVKPGRKLNLKDNKKRKNVNFLDKLKFRIKIKRPKNKKQNIEKKTGYTKNFILFNKTKISINEKENIEIIEKKINLIHSYNYFCISYEKHIQDNKKQHKYCNCCHEIILDEPLIHKNNHYHDFCVIQG